MSGNLIYGLDSNGKMVPIDVSDGMLHMRDESVNGSYPPSMYEMLQQVLVQLKIANAYNQVGHDEEITESDLKESEV